ncbi:MAG: Omp28-related outer membrane protein [Bacteroidales bacterium]|nr:Omp28-related outer membrane protein [Bacteroidales bacterium]
MKKIFILLIVLFSSAITFAQYSQNFDTYTHGDYIGVVDNAWSTWSGTTGGSEDAKIDSNQAASPNNSIYFMSTSSNGGPQDVVLDFGGAYNTGNFEFVQNIYIPANKGAYFNFQAESAIGTTWALNCNFINDSMMYIDDAKSVHLTTNYPVATWFEFKLTVDLNTNIWELYIDNILKKTWQNDVNKIASIDYFPMCNSDFGGNNQSEFWIDDVSYTHTPYTLPTKNAGVVSVSFNGPAIAGSSSYPVVKVRNLGTTAITAFDIEFDYNGIQYQKSVTGISLASLASEEVMANTLIPIIASANTLTATITAVNGTTGDDDNTDDVKAYTFTPIVPAAGKMVIVEEATGTWCGWCPRGTVALEFLAKDYHGFAQGIAVHNGDPMTDSIYDIGIGTLISGYPSALVNRGNDINPSTIWSYVNDALVTPPTAFLVNGAKITGNKLEVSITADFKAIANNNWKLACVIVEDSVTGTTSAYNQSNSYSGGGSGDLIMPDGTNWANLPSSVPASQMIYNHVARAISPSFEGYDNSFPTSVVVGDAHTLNFTFIIDPSWDASKIHIVGMLMKPDGTIDNGSSSSISEAIANGFVTGTPVSITNYIAKSNMKLYPNPVMDNFIIDLEDNYSKVNIEIRNSLGQIVHSEEYKNPNTQLQISFNEKPGVYFVSIITNKGSKEVFTIVKM